MGSHAEEISPLVASASWGTLSEGLRDGDGAPEVAKASGRSIRRRGSGPRAPAVRARAGASPGASRCACDGWKGPSSAAAFARRHSKKRDSFSGEIFAAEPRRTMRDDSRRPPSIMGMAMPRDRDGRLVKVRDGRRMRRGGVRSNAGAASPHAPRKKLQKGSFSVNHGRRRAN